MTVFLPGSDTYSAFEAHCSNLRRCVMHHIWTSMKAATNRRAFLRNGITATGATTVGALLGTNASSLLAEQGPEEHSGHLTRGDAALLRFAAAAEILETDFWVQYNELGGIQDNEFPGGG